MSGQLSLNNLKNLRQELSKTINFVREEAGKARDNQKISDQEWQQAKDRWGELETKELELQGLIDSLELSFILNTKEDSPFLRILQATNSLKTAALKINNFGSFLSAIAKVFDIFTSTIKAIKTGGILSFTA